MQEDDAGTMQTSQGRALANPFEATGRVAGELVPIEKSKATLRAYESDLRDIAAWCEERDVGPGLDSLNERRLLAYVLDQLRRRRSPATVKRRLSSYAAAIQHTGKSIPIRFLRTALDRLDAGGGGELVPPLGVLILADDPIVRAGLGAVLDQKGILTWSDPIQDVDHRTLSSWDYVIVWLSRKGYPDRYSAISAVGEIALSITATVPLIAISAQPVGALIRLRLAEAGVRYLLPQAWCVENLDLLLDCLERGDIPLDYHLPTPLALRQGLSLSLEGSLEPLMSAARGLPEKVWNGSTALQHLPMTRAQVHTFRRMAHEVAGVPAPHFSTYASSLRGAPTLPAWVTVRAVIREAFGIEVYDA